MVDVSPLSPGQRLQQAFHSKVSTIPLIDEIPLFDALMDVLPAMGAHPRVDVERYHGYNSQVTFQASPALGGNERQCELSDLKILTYRVTPPKLMRLTFLQAKFERKKVLGMDGPGPRLTQAEANAVQWDLLHHRHELTGFPGNIRPPAKILADARLSSVGSFGFFHQPPGQCYDMAYVSAACICPLNPLSPNAGNRAMEFPRQTTRSRAGSSGHLETKIAGDLEIFGDHVADLTVGTPIIPSSGRTWDQGITRWLQGVLSHNIRQARPTDDTHLAEEVFHLLGDPGPEDTPEPIGAPGGNLIIVRSEMEPLHPE